MCECERIRKERGELMAIIGELQRECFAFGGMSPLGGRWERIKDLVWDGVKVFVPVGMDKKQVVSGELDVADCAVTLEEARGVIRRMEKRIAKLEKEKEAMDCELRDLRVARGRW